MINSMQAEQRGKDIHHDVHGERLVFFLWIS